MTSILEMSSIERDQLVRKMMAYSPKELEHAIETITQTNIDFGKKMIEAGADGIFYATHWATTDRMTKEQHDAYCRPYDLKILDEMNKAGGWFNMMHVHGRQNLMFDWIVDYPVQSYNWEDVECAPTKGSLADVSAITDKVLIAGINLWEDLYNENNDREAIKAVLKNRLVNALKDCKDNTRFIFAPGCGFPLDLDNYVFTLIQEVADEVSVK
jgi:uroporphyrinogen decarboxylase